MLLQQGKSAIFATRRQRLHRLAAVSCGRDCDTSLVAWKTEDGRRRSVGTARAVLLATIADHTAEVPDTVTNSLNARGPKNWQHLFRRQFRFDLSHFKRQMFGSFRATAVVVLTLVVFVLSQLLITRGF